MATSAVARAEPPCSGPKLVLEPSLSHRRAWSEAALDARRKVAELTDVDACTRLEVGRTGHAIQVKASAADGRSVVRDLSSPGELEPTVVALLVLPPRGEHDDDLAVSPRDEPAEPVKAAANRVPVAVPPRPASTTADEGAVRGAARPYAPRSLEVALGGSARSAAYLLGPSVGLLVNARLDGWLVGGVAHAEQTSTSSASSTQFTKERSASFGFVLGRRLLTGPVYVDVALEAPVLAVSTSTWTAEVTSGGDDDGQEPLEPGSDDPVTSTTTTHSKEKVVAPHADLRAGGLIRAVMPFGVGFGAFSQLDAEHTLGVLPEPSGDGQPRTIAWNAGLSLGLFWSSL